MGNDNFTAAPSGSFRTADGLLNIAANKQEQFEALTKEIGREELIADQRFADREERKKHRGALTLEIEAGARGEDRGGVGGDSQSRREFPPAALLRCPKRWTSPQVKYRELLQTFDGFPGSSRRAYGNAGRIQVVGRRTRRVSSPPPRLGEHTDEILREAGYTVAEIADLRKSGAI